MSNMVNISDYLFFQEGPGVRNNQYTSEGVKLLNVANLQNGKVILDNTSRYISEDEAYGKYKHFLVDPGDLIIASSGIKVEYFEKKMGFVSQEQLPLCMNTSTIRFKTLDKEKLDIKYFMYFLKSDCFKRQLFKMITGSAQLNFGPSHLKKMMFPLVSIDEQKRIINYLESIDEAISIKEEIKKDINELIDSKFNEMFSNDIDDATNEKKLIEVSDFIDYRGKTPTKVDSGIPLITAKNVRKNYFSYEPREYITFEEYKERMTRGFPKPGDVLFTTEGPLANVCLIPEFDGEFSVGQRLITMQPHSGVINSEYLKYILCSDAIQNKIFQKATGSTVLGIKAKYLKEITIPVPKLDKQDRFKSFYNSCEELLKITEEDLKSLRELMNSKLSEFFD